MKKYIYSSICGLLFCTAVLCADDLCPPSWRGDDNSLYAGWDCWNISGRNTIYADFGSWDGLDTPWARITATNYSSVLESYAGRDNVFKTFDAVNPLEFVLKNFPGGDSKRVRLQITYFDENGLTAPTYVKYRTDGQDWLKACDLAQACCEDLGNGWKHVAYDFTIRPNPACEEITFGFDTCIVDLGLTPAYIDQVVIDTICVPEPATVSLLCLGTAAFMRKRRSASQKTA